MDLILINTFMKVITSLSTHNVKLSRSSRFCSFLVSAQFPTANGGITAQQSRSFKLPCYKTSHKRHPLYQTFLNGAISTLAQEAGLPSYALPVVMSVQ